MTMTVTAPDQRPIRHREAMALAHTAYDRVAGVVEGLSGADWDRPTDCAEWTVRDLVGHLVGAMRSAASVRAMLAEQREVARRVKAHGGVQTDHMTAIQVESTADLTTDQLTAEIRRLVGPATAGRRRIPAPVRRLVSFQVDMGDLEERWKLGYLTDVILTRDAWLHRVDLCRAVGAELELTADHDGRLVGDVVAEWAQRHGRPYHLTLTGPIGATFTADTKPSPGEPHAVEPITVDAVEFCRVVSGRAPGEGLLATFVPF